MEFEDDDDHDEEEEDDDDDGEGITIPPHAHPTPATATATAAAGTSSSVVPPHTGSGSRYRECQKNHAVSIGGHAVDGCGEFMPAGEDGTLDALKCAACGCHRNFHRKETDSSSAAPSPELTGAAASSSAAAAAAAAALYQPQFPPYYRTPPGPPPPPSGYLHHHQQQHPRPLALPSTAHEMEELSNPSSSGGGVGSGGGKKRHRTKFTAEQKERMVEFAERIGWRIQKQDEAAVEQFCRELHVSRQVLKVWLHNNKHTLGRKP